MRIIEKQLNTATGLVTIVGDLTGGIVEYALLIGTKRHVVTREDALVLLEVATQARAVVDPLG